MRKKKVLVQGTLDSLQKFFADAVSNDYETVAILSEENISVEDDDKALEVLSPQALPKFIYRLIDAIIITDGFANKNIIDYFLEHGLAPRKLILWNADEGWGNLTLTDSDGTQVIYFCGLEFHVRDKEGKNFCEEIYQRLKIQWRLKILEPQLYHAALTRIFQKDLGRMLDFSNLRTFTEKLQWLKIYDATPLKSRLADKYLVRNWVAEKIGNEYLIPLLGVWNDFDDINFDDLPDQFILKCNHGSGMNIIVRDKKSFDKQRAREKINAWLAVDYAAHYFELHYTRIDRKIIAEKFMTNGNAPDLTDYKFWCFDGKPVIIQLQTETSSLLRADHFDLNWNLLDIERSDHPHSDHPERISPPKNFELMKKLAAKLAEGFAFVRVDFYEIEGKVYFGEMTFTPGAGNFYYKSEGTDEYLGKLLKLPTPTAPPKF